MQYRTAIVSCRHIRSVLYVSFCLFVANKFDLLSFEPPSVGGAYPLAPPPGRYDVNEETRQAATVSDVLGHGVRGAVRHADVSVDQIT